ncbi:MAG: hypothetical protein O7F73_19510 [Gammaproteobacteria bacterium]|nr:hypothetical protein [Gammaproteobacteria bacterium]
MYSPHSTMAPQITVALVLIFASSFSRSESGDPGTRIDAENTKKNNEIDYHYDGVVIFLRWLF